MALLLTGLGSVLYDLQINNGETYRRQSQYKIAETETVEADGARSWTGTAGCWCRTRRCIR